MVPVLERVSPDPIAEAIYQAALDGATALPLLVEEADNLAAAVREAVVAELERSQRLARRPSGRPRSGGRR